MTTYRPSLFLPLLGLLLAALPLSAETVPLAFPGAEGFGARAQGGRGGQVLFVTSLADHGPGSLREAINARGPRMILFRKAGIVDLESPLELREPFVTIAGESAPGDGICLRGFGLTVRTHDVIIRHLRVRPGDVRRQPVDAISIANGSRRVILDHVSASWSVDETLSPSGDIADITVQWSIISESLRESVHTKGSHGYGTLLRAVGGVTLHHNLWAHHNGRNPRFGDNYGKGEPPQYEFRHNVLYNCGDYCSGLTEGRMQVNYWNNWIQPGPNTSKKAPIYLGAKANSQTQFFVAGNHVAGRPEHSTPAGIFERKNLPAGVEITVAKEPFVFAAVATAKGAAESAAAAREAVLAEAGATRPHRDAIDARIVKQVKELAGRLIDSPEEVGGWPAYATAPALSDADNDGIPDAWEKAHGLNPKLATDAAVVSASGYTPLEHYLHELASPFASASPVGTAAR